MIIFRGAVKVSGSRFDPAVVIDTLFETNGWDRSWRDAVYDFVHYHSQIHEVSRSVPALFSRTARSAANRAPAAS